MPISEAQKKRLDKYKKANYARLELTVKKEYKAEIKAAADAAGQSVNAYILAAVEQRMQAEK